LGKGSLDIGIAFRLLRADDWLVGRESRPDKAPFGRPLFLDIRSVDLTMTYAITDRYSVTMTAPFSRGTHSRFYGDGVRHEVSAAGLGDLNLGVQAWFWDPRTHPVGNLSAVVGVKTPSGSHEVIDNWYIPGGSMTWTVDQSIQLGDGGWGIFLQTQGFRRTTPKAWVYGSASYLASPRDQTAVLQAPSGPYSRTFVSVPDVFQARGGFGYAVWPRHGLTATAGVRLDGIPLHDLLGASDGFRRPALIGYAEPGLTYSRGQSTVTVNVPLRIFYDFRASAVDRQLGLTGGGDLASYLVFVGYTYRMNRPGRGDRPVAAPPGQGGQHERPSSEPYHRAGARRDELLQPERESTAAQCDVRRAGR
jgi:hypothetical protein